jgi:hypothetical protein
MTDNQVGKPTKAPHLRVIVNENFVDHVDVAAQAYATKLETEYASRASKSGVNFATCIDVTDFPEDEVASRVVAHLVVRGWDVEAMEYHSSGCRAGAFWLTPKNPNRKF